MSRKILLQDIALLNEYGYEVLTYKKKYHFYYVVNRHFDSAEIAFLADAVQASKLIPIQASKTFFAWVVGTQGKMRILAPQTVCDQFNEFVTKIKEEY